MSTQSIQKFNGLDCLGNLVRIKSTTFSIEMVVSMLPLMPKLRHLDLIKIPILEKKLREVCQCLQKIETLHIQYNNGERSRYSNQNSVVTTLTNDQKKTIMQFLVNIKCMFCCCIIWYVSDVVENVKYVYKKHQSKVNFWKFRMRQKPNFQVKIFWLGFDASYTVWENLGTFMCHTGRRFLTNF